MVKAGVFRTTVPYDRLAAERRFHYIWGALCGHFLSSAFAHGRTQSRTQCMAAIAPAAAAQPQLGVSADATARGPSPYIPARRSGSEVLEQLVPGAVVETPVGVCYVVEQRYAPGTCTRRHLRRQTSRSPPQPAGPFPSSQRGRRIAPISPQPLFWTPKPQGWVEEPVSMPLWWAWATSEARPEQPAGQHGGRGAPVLHAQPRRRTRTPLRIPGACS